MPVTRATGPQVLSSAAKIATHKITHDKRKRLYNEYQAGKAAFHEQIIEVISPDFMQPLRNTSMDTINDSIPDIFTLLRNTCGQLSQAQL